MNDTPNIDDIEQRALGGVIAELERELATSHAVAEQLAEALEWALDKEPSPCRCVSFSIPPHVCTGHRALTTYRANHPKP